MEKELLKYERLISVDESIELHAKLKKIWHVNGYWYPLRDDVPDNTKILPLIDSVFEEYKPKLREKLLLKNVKRIYVLREYDRENNEYEMDTEIFDPFYGNGGEGFWFDAEFKWLIYASHEDSITFAGDFIVEIVKEIFPEYHMHTWGDPIGC